MFFPNWKTEMFCGVFTLVLAVWAALLPDLFLAP